MVMQVPIAFDENCRNLRLKIQNCPKGRQRRQP
jgi:hypothetical protein